MIGLGRESRSDVSRGDVAPETHETRRDREMSGVKHLYDFSRDFVAAEPFAIRKPRLNQIREDVSPLFAACNTLVDDANSCVHPARRTGPHHGQGSRLISVGGTDILLSVRFREREHSGTAVAGS